MAACAPSGEDPRGVEALEFASAVLGAIRKKKSEEQRPLKTRVALAVVHAPPAQLLLFPDVEQDLRSSGLIDRLEASEADVFSVDVDLAADGPVQDRRG
jgi:hypothetical protein